MGIPTGRMGLAFATKAAQCGMIPIVMDMDTSKFEKVSSDLRAAGAPDVFTAKADVSKMAELAGIAKDVEARFPAAQHPISIICANAGYALGYFVGTQRRALMQFKYREH